MVATGVRSTALLTLGTLSKARLTPDNCLFAWGEVIWDALKAACDEPNPQHAALILDSAGVIVSKADLSECYDAKGEHALSSPSVCATCLCCAPAGSGRSIKPLFYDMYVCAGFKYELPKLVVAPPQNLRPGS